MDIRHNSVPKLNMAVSTAKILRLIVTDPHACKVVRRVSYKPLIVVIIGSSCFSGEFKSQLTKFFGIAVCSTVSSFMATVCLGLLSMTVLPSESRILTTVEDSV